MMDKVSALITPQLSGPRPTISFEFFPPKDDAGFVTLRNTFAKLQAFSPDFVSVTYGAMGSNQDSSIAVVQELSAQVPTIAHLTCIGSTISNIKGLIDAYSSAGVAGILALRGDTPRDFVGDPLGDFHSANDLVTFISDYEFEIGVAAFPEKHPESPSLAHDLEVLRLKQDSGATFAMTQLFFEIDSYFDLVSSARDAGITMPIVPGVMPIANAKQVLRMAQMSGAKVPEVLVDKLSSEKDEEAARSIGMEFSADLTKALIAGGAPGVHIFTLNHHKATVELLEASGLA
jgi:methylenetetrahydrofolate reductase (NADPH)